MQQARWRLSASIIPDVLWKKMFRNRREAEDLSFAATSERMEKYTFLERVSISSLE